MIICDVLLSDVLLLLLSGGLMISSGSSLDFHTKILSLLTDVIKHLKKGVEIFSKFVIHHQQSNFHYSEYCIHLVILH